MGRKFHLYRSHAEKEGHCKECLHFMNNNLIPIINGEYDISVLENQTTTWASLIPALILNGIIFGLFLFAKEFRKENE